MSITVISPPTANHEPQYKFPVLVKVEIKPGYNQWFTDVYRDELREIEGAFCVLKVVEQ